MKIPQVGELLGRYRLIERIGAGGMAEVFLARLEGPAGFARTVALKVVHPDTEDDGHLLDLVDEARVAGLLRHPNIVRVHELEQHDDGFYLVMEYLDGRPLDQLLRASRMAAEPPTVPAVVDVGLQVLDALAYAHAAKDEAGNPLELVHRDIKPSNLMVGDRGVVTVVDFGIARAATLERRTATGIGKGTPAYMAPEQLSGAPVGPSSDLFSLGALMFEMATGQRLFDSRSLVELIHKRQAGVTPEEAARIEAVHPRLARVILRALAQDPADRYRTADAMAEALRPLSSAHPGVPLRQWISSIGGTESVSEPAVSTRVASVGGTKRASEKRDEPRWVEGSPSPEVDPTRVLDGIAATTRVVLPSPTSSPRRSSLALVGAVLLFGVVAWLTSQRTTNEVSPSSPSVAPTPKDERTPVVETPVLLLGSPPSDSSPTDATPVAGPASTAVEPRETPAPTPEPSPSPRRVSPPASAEPLTVATSGTAMAEVFLNIVGSGGQVEIVGRGRRATPTTYRVPSGNHPLRLLDQNDGTLAEFTLVVGAGEEARCLWKRDGAKLTRLADPDGAPCDVR